MKKFFLLFVVFVLLAVPVSVFAQDDGVVEDYKAYYIPWIVNTPPTWWAGINLKNISEQDQDVCIRYENEFGDVINDEVLIVPAHGTYRWILQDTETRSILIECNGKIFVTALMGHENEGITELEVREITNLKN